MSIIIFPTNNSNVEYDNINVFQELNVISIGMEKQIAELSKFSMYILQMPSNYLDLIIIISILQLGQAQKNGKINAMKKNTP